MGPNLNFSEKRLSESLLDTNLTRFMSRLSDENRCCAPALCCHGADAALTQLLFDVRWLIKKHREWHEVTPEHPAITVDQQMQHGQTLPGWQTGALLLFLYFYLLPFLLIKKLIKMPTFCHLLHKLQAVKSVIQKPQRRLWLCHLSCRLKLHKAAKWKFCLKHCKHRWGRKHNSVQRWRTQRLKFALLKLLTHCRIRKWQWFGCEWRRETAPGFGVSTEDRRGESIWAQLGSKRRGQWSAEGEGSTYGLALSWKCWPCCSRLRLCHWWPTSWPRRWSLVSGQQWWSGSCLLKVRGSYSTQVPRARGNGEPRLQQRDIWHILCFCVWDKFHHVFTPKDIDLWGNIFICIALAVAHMSYFI